MQRRNQMNDAAKLGIGYGNILAGWMGNMGQNDAAMEGVRLQRDQWEEWVRRRRAQTQPSTYMKQNAATYGGGGGSTAGYFQEQYGG